MSPFDLLDEICDATPSGSWMLVGGLMVHAHAWLADITSPRPTLDADLVVELSVISYPEMATHLHQLGFSPHDPIDPGSPFHRFRRATHHIDLMAPEGRMVSFLGRTVVEVPGAISALKRTIPFTTPGGRTIRVPDLESALSLKGAAWEMPSPNPGRHLQDGVLLFACAGRRELNLSKSMRTNINKLLRGLEKADAWRAADPLTTLRAVRAIQGIRSDWTPPPSVANHVISP